MKKHCLLLVLCFSSFVSFSQSHVDSTNSFTINVPAWWSIRETPANMFGGTFPAIDSIENALVFKSFKKDKFKDLADFEKWVIKDYSMGQTPKWSSQYQVLIKKQIEDFKGLGNAYKVQMLRGDKIYDCCYILTETNSSFVWIDFTATSKTYLKNWEKFKEVVNSYKKL